MAIMVFLLTIVGLVIFARLWEGFPRRFGVLPGANWALGLTVVYYCMTFSLVVGVIYLTGGFFEQRQRYLWIVLGTVLAVAGALERSGRWSLVNVLSTVLLVVVVVVAYGAAHVASPPINAALDRLGAPSATAASPRP